MVKLRSERSSLGKVVPVVSYETTDDDFNGVLSSDVKEEMLNYIRKNQELNRDLYEITNSHLNNKLDDLVEEEKPKKESTEKKDLRLYDKQFNKGVRKFKNEYDKYEDQLIVNDLNHKVWEKGENIAETISVDLASNFIGKKSGYVYISSKLIMLLANVVFMVAFRIILQIGIILRSTFRKLF